MKSYSEKNIPVSRRWVICLKQAMWNDILMGQSAITSISHCNILPAHGIHCHHGRQRRDPSFCCSMVLRMRCAIGWGVPRILMLDEWCWHHEHRHTKPTVLEAFRS